jgi:hypothetical protein
MYKLNNDIINKTVCSVNKLDANMSIPFAPDNTDYQQFVRDIKNGVQLNDANGNAITGTELTTFISTLP